MKKLLAAMASALALLAAAPAVAAPIPGYDSVTLSAIPANPLVVGGYVAGAWPTFDAVVQRFPHAIHISIATQASQIVHDGRPVDCLDTEPGDAVPSQDRQWVLAEIRAGESHPCIYAMGWWMSQVKADVAGLPVVFWDAAWDGNPGIPAGFGAHQWASTPSLDYDSFGRGFLQALGLLKIPVVDIGGAQHYERYPSGYVVIDGQRMRERNTVMTWDSADCRNPVRRGACISTRAHLALLLSVDQAAYRRLHDRNHLPGRIQGIVNRLDRRGVVRRWL